ncbi:MAG: hypothetical protein H8E17_02650 [Deltaproteobacteria bacterium]|nr:hypothetical protein [Deltaproteobacteria bacterium]
MEHKLGITLIEILVIITIIVLNLTIVLPMRNVPDRMGPIQLTNAQMQRLGFYLIIYYFENNKWPDVLNWKEQIENIYPEATPLDNLSDYYIDGWDNPIQYRVIEENGTQTALLYSFGKNKTDDNGTGDDITREVEIPTQEEIKNYKASD